MVERRASVELLSRSSSTFVECTCRAVLSSKIDENRLGEFQGRYGDLPRHGREVVEEFIECLSTLEVVQQSLKRNARASKHGCTAEDVCIPNYTSWRRTIFFFWPFYQIPVYRRGWSLLSAASKATKPHTGSRMDSSCGISSKGG